MLQTTIGNCAISNKIKNMQNTCAKCDKCLFTNGRSLPSKIGELEALVHEENYDLMGIAESWLDSSNDCLLIFLAMLSKTEGWWCLSLCEK